MKKRSENELLRLHRIILTDDTNIPNSTVEILKADTRSFFDNHFRLDEDSFKMNITVAENGSYEVEVSFRAKDMYDIKVIK
ncbi:MAG TPA: hypothetical protein PKY53_05170 [Clostridia bacterium]|jgi:hypothetical protein|nr:hypothetical protein [Clostridia bacterium]